jgi:hypothetical protein
MGNANSPCRYADYCNSEGLCTNGCDERLAHQFDDDGCCTRCGFDGAEWHWWKHSTYEGRAQPDAKIPKCIAVLQGRG